MTLLTLRGDLAALLTGALPAGVVVYDHPAETVALPAVVFVPAATWWEHPRLSGAPLASGTRVTFDLQVIVPRGVELSTAFTELETLSAAVITTASLMVKWRDLGGVEPVTVNETPALMARLGMYADL